MVDLAQVSACTATTVGSSNPEEDEFGVKISNYNFETVADTPADVVAQGDIIDDELDAFLKRFSQSYEDDKIKTDEEKAPTKIEPLTEESKPKRPPPVPARPKHV